MRICNIHSAPGDWKNLVLNGTAPSNASGNILFLANVVENIYTF